MSGRIECDGGPHCQASPHVHGCFADRGDCDDRKKHLLDRLAALERVAEAAARVHAANAAYTTDHVDDSSEAQPLCAICVEWLEADMALGTALDALAGKQQ